MKLKYSRDHERRYIFLDDGRVIAETKKTKEAVFADTEPNDIEEAVYIPGDKLPDEDFHSILCFSINARRAKAALWSVILPDHSIEIAASAMVHDPKDESDTALIEELFHELNSDTFSSRTKKSLI